MINKEKITVTSSKVIKNKTYEIIFSNDLTMTLNEDVVVKYRLVKGKELELEEIDKIKEDCDFFEAYQLGIKYITNRAKSSYQVKTYLLKKEFESYIIDRVIAYFIENKFIDDEAYSLDYAKYLMNQGYGKKIISYKLKTMGIPNDLINNSLELFDLDEYEEMACMIALKQNRNYMKLDEKARDLKLRNYLLSRGYEYDVIYSVMKKVNRNE